MSDKFTPGPWDCELVHDGEHDYYAIEGQVIRAGRSGSVANTLNRDFVIDPDTDFANARLIASAPDLLAACEACRTHLLGKGGDTVDVYDQVVRAINKAKGSDHV